MAMLRVPVTDKDHATSGDQAAVTLVEYGDYQCPYCGDVYPVVERIREHFGRKLRFVFRHFPLVEVHPFAANAAQSAEFAGEHGKFWQMHDLLYLDQAHLDTDDLLRRCKALGLPADDLLKALESELYMPRIQENFMGGVRSGVNGTPSFFINGARYEGAYDFDEMLAAVAVRL